MGDSVHAFAVCVMASGPVELGREALVFAVEEFVGELRAHGFTQRGVAYGLRETGGEGEGSKVAA